MKTARRPAQTSREHHAPESESNVSAHAVVFTAVFLGLATFLLYIPTFRNDFIFGYDDNSYIVDNGVVPRGLTLDGIRWAFTTSYFANWLPITWLSHMLDVSLFGMNPGGHHAMSAVIHGLNAGLLLLCLFRLTGRPWPSIAAAVLFAIHPLRVESVAWVAERKDVLAAMFFLLAVLAYARYARTPSVHWYAVVFLLHALGLMSKTMIVTLPAVLLLLDWWPLGRLRLGWLLPSTAAAPDPGQSDEEHPVTPRPIALGWLLLEKVPLLALSAIASIWTVILQEQGEALEYGQSFSLYQRIANAFVSIPRYLSKTFVPMNLAILYPHPGDWPTWALAASAVLVAGISIACFVLRKRAPFLLVGWLWFIVMLLPVLGILQAGMQSMADRYMYLPGIGITVAIVWLVAQVLRHRPSTVPGWIPATITSVIAIALSAVTIVQEKVWADKFTLFSHALDATDGNWLAHSHVGSGLFDEGRYDEAMHHFRRSYEINPGFANGHQNLGNVLFKIGKHAEAEAEFKEAIRIKPSFWLPYMNLGSLLRSQQRLPEAAEVLEQGLRLKPADPSMSLILARVRVAQGRRDEALTTLQAGGVAVEKAAASCVQYGNELVRSGNFAEAEKFYGDAVGIDPNSAQAHYSLGTILAQTGHLVPATEQYRQAVLIDPKHAQAQHNLGIGLAMQGRTQDALAPLSAATQLRPDWAEAHVDLAKGLMQANRPADADRVLTQFLQAHPQNRPVAQFLAQLRRGGGR